MLLTSMLYPMKPPARGREQCGITCGFVGAPLKSYGSPTALEGSLLSPVKFILAEKMAPKFTFLQASMRQFSPHKNKKQMNNKNINLSEKIGSPILNQSVFIQSRGEAEERPAGCRRRGDSQLALVKVIKQGGH